MKTRAAIAWEPNQPLEIEEIDLEGPKEGEVLVRIVTTSLCHTDVFTLSGEDPEGLFPCILGHEGCGVLWRRSAKALHRLCLEITSSRSTSPKIPIALHQIGQDQSLPDHPQDPRRRVDA